MQNSSLELMTNMNNKFKEGDIVYASTDLHVKLRVRRYVDRIYYCQLVDHPDQKELVYFERELTNENS